MSVATRAAVRAAIAIARNTVREGLRARLPLVWLALAGGLLGLQSFVSALAMIDGSAVVLSLAAPVARLAAVIVTAVFVIAPLARELGERGTEIVFSAPIPRASWALGRIAGHAALAAGTALAATLPLLLHAEAAPLARWGLTLAGECALVAALASLVTFSLERLPLSLLAVLAFYACARLIGVIEMIQKTRASEGAIDAFIGTLALVLPRFDLNARTAWLVDPGAAAPGALLAALLQTALYGAIVLVAASLDVERRRA